MCRAISPVATDVVSNYRQTQYSTATLLPARLDYCNSILAARRVVIITSGTHNKSAVYYHPIDASYTATIYCTCRPTALGRRLENVQLPS